MREPKFRTSYASGSLRQTNSPANLVNHCVDSSLVATSAPCYSLLSRRMPSTIGCQPYTSVIMNPSMRMSEGPLSLTVDL